MVDFARISRVEAVLLRLRALYSQSTETHRVSALEAAAADELRALSPDEYEVLEHLVGGKGFDLRTERDYPGLPRGGQVWLLVRRPNHEGPDLLTMGRAWERTALGRDKPTTVYWFTFLWFLTLSLLYEKAGRAVTEVSRYVEPNFSPEDLEHLVEEHLEGLRREGGAVVEGPVAQVLLKVSADKGTSGGHVRRRISAFLDTMWRGGMLDRVGSDSSSLYSQTLLCAMQLEALFAQDLMPLLPDNAAASDIPGHIGSLVHARSARGRLDADGDDDTSMEAEDGAV